MKTLIMRLLKDGKIIANKVPVSPRLNLQGEDDDWFDDIELGIQVGEETWYAGDRGITASGGIFTVVFNGEHFICVFQEDGWIPTYTINCLADAKRIGNIHDKEAP